MILWLANYQRKIALHINFLNFIFVEIPDVEQIKEVMKEFDVQWRITSWKKFQGYSNQKYPFLVLYSDDTFQLSDLVKQISAEVLDKKGKLTTYMSNFSLMQKFSAVSKINVGDWIKCDAELIESESVLPMYSGDADNIEKAEIPSPEFFPNYKIACIDFEVYSSRKGKFPDPWEPKDEIYLISYVLTTSKNADINGYVLTTKETGFEQIIDQEHVAIIRKSENEMDLLADLEKVIMDTDPDIIITYNGDSFDYPYWKVRIDRNCLSLGQIGRLYDKKTIFKRNDWSSSAFKSRAQELMIIPGRITGDLFTMISRDEKLPVYNLKFVSEHYLKKELMKFDLEAEEQFRIYESGTKEEWQKLLEYSFRDSIAPLQIMKVQNILNNLFANARIIGINIEDIYTRGQQFRLENKLFQKLLNAKTVIDPSKEKGFSKFTGAVVQEPVLELVNNVSALDFQSLYPSIIIAYNISHDTYLTEIPPELSIDDVWVVDIEGVRQHYFVKQHIRIGAVPQMVADLLASRLAKKKAMKNEKNPELKAILDKEQLALKVIANSSFGFLGASTGKLPLKAGAESVTAIGRKLITEVIEWLKEDYRARIIYGDTDSVYFTLPHWEGRNGAEAIKEMMAETDRMGKAITQRINHDPIIIVLDHFFTDHLNLSKKFYISNEVKEKGNDIDIEVNFKGVFYSRREHAEYAKRLYYDLTMLGIGRSKLGDVILPKADRKWQAEELLWEKMIDLLTFRVPLKDLTKINQMGEDYKSQSYPLAVFQREEERRGRPIKAGERFKYWYVKSREKLAGYRIRRVLEEGDIIDYHYYLDVMETAITKLLEGMFQNGNLYKTYLSRIGLKRTMQEELLYYDINDLYFPREDWKKVQKRMKKK